MTTLLHRGPGPDKRFDMTESTSAERSDRGTKPGPPASNSSTRLTWIPAVAALLTFLIGISDVLAVFKPNWHEKLHKVNAVVPGTLTNVTRTSDVIIGLLLLMLARGLRRRKRRAWQAVIGLLTFDIVIHFFHFPSAISVSGCVAIVLLAVLIYRHDDFYAVGDPRTRRTARSEEHTSELQSREKLVCRLLLEKKKKIKVQLLEQKQTKIIKIHLDNDVIQ